MRADDRTIQALRRNGLLLVWTGELWNVVEAAVALWAGVGNSSVALVAFGFDSFIELFAGGVLIWHLTREWGGRDDNEAAEGRARKLIGITFFLLAAFILAQSIATLTGVLARPQESIAGIALLGVSAVVMSALYSGKTRTARRLGSPALRAEAIESLVCGIQDVTLLVGLGLNALWGLWWADPIAALALIPFLVIEGREGINGEND